MEEGEHWRKANIGGRRKLLLTSPSTATLYVASVPVTWTLTAMPSAAVSVTVLAAVV